MKSSLKYIMLITALLIMLTGDNLMAHYNWIQPEKTVAKTGEIVKVFITGGHHFPESQATMDINQISVYAITPAGEKVPLSPVPGKNAHLIEYRTTSTGHHTLYFENDRGIISKTTKGWQSGGKDIHPKAITSINFYSSGIAYIDIGEKPSYEVKPVGLKLELTCRIEKKEPVINAYSNLKPVKDMEILLVEEGKKPQKIGKTDSTGTLRYKPSTPLKGKILLMADEERKMPGSANYETEVFKTTLYLDIK